MTTPRIPAALLAALLVLPTRAHAFEPATTANEAAPANDDVDAVVARARERFDAGDFAGAIADFELAYTMRADPSFIYNVARISEEAGDLDAAIAGYRRFIRAPGLELDQRAQALERIEVLQRVRDAARDPVAAPTPTPTPVPDETTKLAPSPAPQTDTRPPGRVAMRTGFGLLGAGAGVMVVGFVLGGLALRESQQLRDTDDPDARRRRIDRGSAEALATDVLVGTGGAIVLAGVIAVAVGAAKRKQAARASVALGVGRGGLALRF